ncbi:hypothetical protein COHA_003004 [Chlorella ohadii]|uniref:Uncharacterized protein n=1 Tax=Chlorella ohadii TaxID=2649997 RepID=A0AAD5DSC0_9CHLO|nr:hypothetical protein COHA_003004 [Chlorella ohadii]
MLDMPGLLSSWLHPRCRRPEQRRRGAAVQPRAEQQDGSSGSGGRDAAEDLPVPEVPKQRRRRRKAEQQAKEFTIDDLNPISMGRKSREVFDDVWTQLQRIGNPARSAQAADRITRLVGEAEFESLDAADTTVLVTGATGRVGRVLVRKLLLRGYKVKALVRQREGGAAAEAPAAPAPAAAADGSTSVDGSDGQEALPQAAELVYGDVADYKACRQAVKGVDKVICCSGARTTITADLARVDDLGVSNLAKAFMDELNTRARRQGQLSSAAKRELADFSNEAYHEAWNVVAVGPPTPAEGEDSMSKAKRRAIKRATARDSAEAYIDEDNHLVFEGAVYSRGGLAEVGAPVQLPYEDPAALNASEALVVRLLGDEHPYTCVLRTRAGITYTTRFATRHGYNTVRLPFNIFRPVVVDDPPLQPGEVEYIGFRFEPRIKVLEEVTEPGQSMFDASANRFKLMVDWIKTLPGGVETDFVLLSCSGAPRPDLAPASRDKVVTYKRKGEAALRNSGLGYTIVRPGPLVEEAGGYKALVFDQGNRITQGISCADVADVCLKALHNPEARNKTFEVCFEYQPEEGLEFYELISHLPDKSNNYLTPALAPLTKNT